MTAGIQWFEKKPSQLPGRPMLPTDVVEFRLVGKKFPEHKARFGADVVNAMGWRSGDKVQIGVGPTGFYFRKHKAGFVLQASSGRKHQTNCSLFLTLRRPDQREALASFAPDAVLPREALRWEAQENGVLYAEMKGSQG